MAREFRRGYQYIFSKELFKKHFKELYDESVEANIKFRKSIGFEANEIYEMPHWSDHVDGMKVDSIYGSDCGYVTTYKVQPICCDEIPLPFNAACAWEDAYTTKNMSPNAQKFLQELFERDER